MLPVEPGEKVTAMLHVKDMAAEAYLLMVTRRGTVKRIQLTDINTARKAGIRAITLEEDDELISVRRTDGRQNILLVTREGMGLSTETVENLAWENGKHFYGIE